MNFISRLLGAFRLFTIFCHWTLVAFLYRARVQGFSKFKNLSRWQIHLERFFKNSSNLFQDLASFQVSLFLTFHVLAPQKSSFSTGFIRVFDMAKCHVRFIYKRNAFLIVSEALLRSRLGNHQFDTGFIRVSATRF